MPTRTVTTARRHGDYPISVAGEFQPRVQNFDLNKNTPTQPYFELGNKTTVGVAQDSTQYTANMTWFPIDNSLECRLLGIAGSFGSWSGGCYVTLKHLVDVGQNGNVIVANEHLKMTGVRVTGIGFSCGTPNGEFQGTVSLAGTGEAAGASITADAPAGVGCYKSKDVKVKLGSTQATRVANVEVNADLSGEDLYEMSNSTVIANEMDSSTVTMNVDFYEADNITVLTNIESTFAITSTTDVSIIAGDDNSGVHKKIICKNMVLGTTGYRGTVRGWATRRYSFTSRGDQTTYGMKIGYSNQS